MYLRCFGVCTLTDLLEKAECGVLILPGTGKAEVNFNAATELCYSSLLVSVTLLLLMYVK